jgi:hypothetical protein
MDEKLDNNSTEENTINNEEDVEQDVDEELSDEEDEHDEEDEQQDEDQEDEENEEQNNFKKIINEFLRDLLTTFPELKDNLNDDLLNIVTCENINDDNYVENFKNIETYCSNIYPERFFDIIYQNEEIFLEESEINTQFLPNIDFKKLWNTNISLKTKNIIWKYLQLILFSIVNNVSNTESFGNTADLFKAIDEDEFKKKIEETMENIQNIFSTNDVSLNGLDDMNFNNEDISNNINFDNLPKPEDIHSHLDGILDGKIGALAKEIADETTKDLNINPDDLQSPSDLFEKLFKNPNQLMGLVKNVGNKLDTKLKSGNLKESELLEEASEIMNKLQSMPGMGNIKEMMSKMGMPSGGKNGNINLAAMQSHLQQNLKNAKQKEKMQEKLRQRNKNKQNVTSNTNLNNISENIMLNETEINNMLNNKNLNIEDFEKLIFSDGTVQEKSPRIPKNPNENNKKKKKRKKKN